MSNRCVLSGRLTADPELRQTQNGISVASFTIAVDRQYTPKDGERQADFIDIVAWRGTAEFVSKYFTKGKWIEVDGSIQTRKCKMLEDFVKALKQKQTDLSFTITGVLMDQGSPGMEFSLKPFCNEVYRISELGGDKVADALLSGRI